MAPHQRPLPIDPIAEAKRQWLLHGWSQEADGMAAVTSIMRAHQLMLARVDAALKPFQLSFARYELLALLSFSREGALPMASASARLQVHPTSVTNTVDRLERDGLVARRAHPTDGRATLVAISAAGRGLVDQATAALNAEVFADLGLPRSEIDELVKILARFRKAAGDFGDPEPVPDPL